LRLAEYGQTKPTPGALFVTVPRTTHAGEWAGSPLAFIRDDFTFYDDKFVHLSQNETRLVESLILSLFISALTKAQQTSLFENFVVSVAPFCAQ
jgi:hypothetical protein